MAVRGDFTISFFAATRRPEHKHRFAREKQFIILILKGVLVQDEVRRKRESVGRWERRASEEDA